MRRWNDIIQTISNEISDDQGKVICGDYREPVDGANQYEAYDELS